MHRVAVLGLSPLATFEVGVAAEAFALARPELEVPWWYEFVLCAEAPGELPAVGGFGVHVAHGLDALDGAGTVIVPGAGDEEPSPAVVDALLQFVLTDGHEVEIGRHWLAGDPMPGIETLLGASVG